MKIALILSGGTGSRLGSDIPKQYINVNNRPIISFCINSLAEVADAIIIVAAKEYHELIKKEISFCKDKFKGFSEPGETRQLSIFNALCDIGKFAADDDIVLIHDAARPNLSVSMIKDCFEKIKGHDGVLPVLPMKDTVYFSENGSQVSKLLTREKIFAGQAPEAFVFGKYIKANEALFPDDIYKINGSTEPAILAGMDIVMIPGDEDNYKITTQNDLKRFEAECNK